MAAGSDEMWDLMVEGSDELAEEIGVADYTAALLGKVDRWLRGQEAPLADDDVARLGMLLARLLCERHGGGLAIIRHKGHPLDGEWAVTGFSRGLANDYHVPFMISAARIAVDRSLTARVWYEQLLAEGR